MHSIAAAFWACCSSVVVVAVVSARIMHMASNCTVNGNERPKYKRKVCLSSSAWQKLTIFAGPSIFTQIDISLQSAEW